MSREDVNFRDRLLFLADSSNPHKPFNVKRKSTITKQPPKSTPPKLSMQDFVRMDPGYTPDIEHLVFPMRKRNNPQQVAPLNAQNSGKTRSRLAEMFALSRHLQQRSADRESKRSLLFNRSMDSAMEPPRQGPPGPRTAAATRRWVEEPVRQNYSFSTKPEPEMSTARGPNVSVLHLRGPSDPWEPHPTYPVTKAVKPTPPLTKHQSLGSAPFRWLGSPGFHPRQSVKVARELSPVRWCDREVDGVYLGKSGWVQVQQRSLDDRRSYATTTSMLPSKKIGIKLADYHCNSEPARPAFLSLQKTHELEVESFSPPPPVTPIISPPPAFQDKKLAKTRTFFGKTPFLPRANAIDSDISPPLSPKPLKWKTNSLTTAPSRVPVRSLAPPKIPQTKSLEDTSAIRRSLFVKHHESSSSSSSSMGFRSLDSFVNKPAMPRLSESTDVYEDADEEDNNSSSVNICVPPVSIVKEKISPSGRQNRYRPPNRKSPASSEGGKTPTCASPGSSSSSSLELPPSRSPLGSQQQLRRTPPRGGAANYPPKPSGDDSSLQRVRRSRSLQLPERNLGVVYPQIRVSPQNKAPKMGTQVPPKRYVFTEKDLLREAEIVSNFIYGARTKAAAQALLNQRYQNMLQAKSPHPKTQRGGTSPAPANLSVPKPEQPHPKNPCNQDTCDFWPHCAHRESIMRSSQSYPTHQRSLDSIKKSDYAKKVSSSSSSSDVWLSSDRTRLGKSSGGSTPNEEELPELGESKREMILTRPGSAPSDERNEGGGVETEKKSMSLPKSFLSVSHKQGSLPVVGEVSEEEMSPHLGGQFQWRRGGTESLGSSPGLPRKINTTTETSQTAPVTPLHEGIRRRSPVSSGDGGRKAKASSTPELLDGPENRNLTNPQEHPITIKDAATRRNLAKTHSFSLSKLFSPAFKTVHTPVSGSESVLQKFRKTFSLRFHQKKSSRDSIENADGEDLAEALDDERPPLNATQSEEIEEKEEKSRFGSLIWRSSKDRKKLNKAARSAKCNSGDSGIQIEMAAPGCGGGAGDSSESHDTDPAGDDLDSPPSVRRRTVQKKGTRPHSDLLNQILIDKFKSDLKQRSNRHNQIRRTRSDLGGQRLLRWEKRGYSRMMSAKSPQRPESPRRKPPDLPGGVQLRMTHRRGGQLRRSLSQPLDIDKLSPLMRTKAAGLRLGTTSHLSEDDQDLRGTSDDDVMMSDSESSTTSLDRKKSMEMIILAEAVFNHVSLEPEELEFRAGDLIEVHETANRDWWWGTTNAKSGWFPAQFVRLRVSQEDTVEDCLAAMAAGRIRRRTSISLLSNDQVRTSVVRELVRTERDFVKVLQDVAEGYIAECRKRSDMFSEEQIATIFINLEEILRFQELFVKDLEGKIDWEYPYKSCVGEVFLRHKAGFEMYSEYCNSHPAATAALQELYQFNNYSKFFEACRLMRGLIEIPLDGYLLTPVQRICKYPLQLAELLKYTKNEHSDYNDIREALACMKGVALLINERKRRMESLEKLVAWQMRVEAWEGEDLIEQSTQLIHQADVVKVTTGMWTNNITLFLFDHQVVYCKKDLLKRNTFVYKGRICLDTSEIIDVTDGKDIHLGVNVRHAIKIYSCIRDKWLLFCCRSASAKLRWLAAFHEERHLVLRDKSDGLEFPTSAKQFAKMAARCQRRPPRKPRKAYKHSPPPQYLGSTLQLNSNSLGRRVGTWFTFNKKSRHQSRDHLS